MNEEEKGERGGTKASSLLSCRAMWVLVWTSFSSQNTMDSIRRFGAENELTGLLFY